MDILRNVQAISGPVETKTFQVKGQTTKDSSLASSVIFILRIGKIVDIAFYFFSFNFASIACSNPWRLRCL